MAGSPTRRSPGGTARGQSMVEFAIVGPMFFLLVLLILEGGLLMNAQTTLDSATREAARAVAICGSATGSFTYKGYQGNDCTGAAMLVAEHNLGINGTALGGFAVTRASAYGQPGSVSVAFKYKPYTLYYLGVSGLAITLTSTAPVVGQQ